MSKRELSRVVLTVMPSPAPCGTGRYEARLEADNRLLCVSRTPFFDAARKLIADGYDPNITLIQRHCGSDTESLRAPLEAAAVLTVEETDYGPKLRRWKPFRLWWSRQGSRGTNRSPRLVAAGSPMNTASNISLGEHHAKGRRRGPGIENTMGKQRTAD